MTWITKCTVNLHKNDEWQQQLINVFEQTKQIIISKQQDFLMLNLIWLNFSIFNHQFCHINYQCNIIYLTDLEMR